MPLHVLERSNAIPYEIDGNVLRVAVSDPGNVHAIDELRLATRLTVELAVASRDDVEAEVRRLVRQSEAFGARAALDEEAEAFAAEEEDEDDLEADDGISDAPLVRLVNSVIFQAAEDGASDIHWEPQEDSLVVRLRIDGVLHEVQRIPKRLAAGVTTRLKVLAKLDIAERRKPQDGRIGLNAAAAGRMMDIRVARPADGRGRVDRHASRRQVEEGADARRARPLRRHAEEDDRDLRCARPAHCS